MIFNNFGDIRDDRTCKALTGLARDQFQELLKIFEASHADLREELYEQGAIKIRHVPGDRGYLKTLEQRLFFLLFYLKNYPTYDVLGFLLTRQTNTSPTFHVVYATCL